MENNIGFEVEQINVKKSELVKIKEYEKKISKIKNKEKLYKKCSFNEFICSNIRIFKENNEISFKYDNNYEKTDMNIFINLFIKNLSKQFDINLNLINVKYVEKGSINIVIEFSIIIISKMIESLSKKVGGNTAEIIVSSTAFGTIGAISGSLIPGIGTGIGLAVGTLIGTGVGIINNITKK